MIKDQRVVVVTGKGGVGKTTTCAALALMAHRAGRRVLICETQGAERVPSLFGQKSQGYQYTTLAPRLRSISISSEAAIEDYLMKVLHFRRIYQMVFRNRIMGPFMDAVPGLHDLVQMGKVMELERTPASDVDLYIVDAPATGHALAMLNAPRTMMDLTVRGPFYENAQLVANLLEDPRKTSLVLVATPEELPINETLELYERLGNMRRQVKMVVLNEVQPPPIQRPERLDAFLPYLRAGADETGQRTLDLAETLLRRHQLQEHARLRLQNIAAPRVEFPMLAHRGLGRIELEQLAGLLERS